MKNIKRGRLPAQLTTLAMLAVLTACAAQPLAKPSQDVANKAAAPAATLPPAADLAFSDFYKMPIGAYGLEPTPRLLSLQGQRVRIRGLMVHDDEPMPGFFMLAPVRVGLGEHADGPADDLPASTVFVRLPKELDTHNTAYVASPVEVTGVLDIGGKTEPDGRVSYVRLQLDSMDAAITAAAVPKPSAHGS
ncbi:hypothetical protein [Hydrocarboniphaga sp.]|uniref:hypothetical protein n=1 Tax=Hydrocarboniphaga sp. TaxID=2033016 RepID=UPI003D0CE51A